MGEGWDGGDVMTFSLFKMLILVTLSCRLDWISEIRDTPYEADYLHYYVWIAEPFNTNVLQHFHQQIMITYITYTIANHYYMRYLSIETESLQSLKTKG